MDEDLLASQVDAIYGLPLEEFTAERDRRVKALRADGHRDEANALGACRKPTVPVWAVNRLARVAADDVAALVTAGDALRGAQHRAASGRGADGLRETTRAVRRLTQRLRELAGEELAQAGTRPDAHLDDVERTLFAAAVDPDWHEPLRRGVLRAPVTGPGFGGIGLAAVPPLEAAGRSATELAGDGSATTTDASATTVTDESDTADEQTALEREREEEARLERERQEEEARRQAARRRELLRRVDALETAREKQAGRVERRAQQANELRERAERAQREADEATEVLVGYERDLAAAREELDRLAAQDDVES